MGTLFRVLVLLLAAAVGGGCGYFQAGMWEDDPANWERAFRSRQPEDVVVLHSLYWRSPHWTWEGGYCFEIEANPSFEEELFRRNRLAQTQRDLRDCFGAPPWFAPKPLGSYEVWTYADEPKGNFRVLRDRETRAVFLCDYQV